MSVSEQADPARFIPLHPLELHVLLVLMEGDLHGYGIAKEIESRKAGMGTIFPTNLYRRLRDMAEKGLLSEAPESQEGQRRLFGITSLGRRVAEAEALRLEALVLDARHLQLLPSQPGEG